MADKLLKNVILFSFFSSYFENHSILIYCIILYLRFIKKKKKIISKTI
jgi:hypothetical protein